MLMAPRCCCCCWCWCAGHICIRCEATQFSIHCVRSSVALEQTAQKRPAAATCAPRIMWHVVDGNKPTPKTGVRVCVCVVWPLFRKYLIFYYAWMRSQATASCRVSHTLLSARALTRNWIVYSRNCVSLRCADTGIHSIPPVSSSLSPSTQLLREIFINVPGTNNNVWAASTAHWNKLTSTGTAPRHATPTSRWRRREGDMKGAATTVGTGMRSRDRKCGAGPGQRA